ncbi:MAG: PBP1A family penicillin-binding protein [Campylobacterota bacterium]|nr:PBP1A family penicillin-binding protein [Campylobacterota bacterium]
MKKIFIYTILAFFASPFLIVAYYATQFSYDTSSVVNYSPKLTTTIYDKNGDKIANIFKGEHRYYATINEIPPRLIEALLAIEDTSFFEHHGVNFDAIFRAIIKDIKAQKLVEGASTITQQLVKNTLLTREKKISRKIKELIYAMKLELQISKEEILERYLNEIYLGHGYYGVKTAAIGYFHKNLDELTLKEMAMLVGLPKAPSFYDPTKNYELSIGRANRVLERMHSIGWIDDEMFNKGVKEQPKVYRETLTQNKAPYIVDEVLRRLPQIEDIKTGGYEIHTTIDLELQNLAKESLSYAYDLAIERAKKANDYNESFMSELNGAFVSIDSKSGSILALVGGVDYKKSSYNRATMGLRQPGSAFKPFIYQSALNLGYSGASKLIDISRTYAYTKDEEELKWQPKNYEKNYEGFITLREALIHSRNLATINLVEDIGLKNMINELSKYSFKSLPHDLSLSLGTINLSPVDMSMYYSSFANGGIQIKPFLIKSIENRDGTLYVHQEKLKYITSPEQTFLLTSILKDVVERGTGRRARAKGIELAGKTGTTNKSVDAWFVGYSATIQTTVWFGNDNNKPMRKKETGGRVSGPAFRNFYTKLITLRPHIKREFDIPKNIVKSTHKGKTEYFTDISKPPRENKSYEVEEELVF